MVSVVVATYRRENELRKALDSLSLQQYDDFEIILVDDNADIKWNEAVKNIVFDFKKIIQKLLLPIFKTHKI